MIKNNSIIIAALVLASCFSVAVKGETLSTPEENFEYLWNAFEKNYALFEVKGVDWEGLYRVYRPKVTETTTDDELFQVISDMLRHLNDNHVVLMSMEPLRFFCAGTLFETLGGSMEAFRELPRKRPFLPGYFKEGLTESENKIFFHGWTGEGVGYVHLNKFSDPEGSGKAIDSILGEFKDARGIIIDVRNNVGGDDTVGKLVAEKFADRKRHYLRVKTRIEGSPGEFGPVEEWHLEPKGPPRYAGPVVILANRRTLSAAENFLLAMKTLPNVTIVGETTSGCFGSARNFEMPNGWRLMVTYKLFTDQTGFCWEGIGVTPHLRQPDFPEDPEQGIDRPLELAVALLDK